MSNYRFMRLLLFFDLPVHDIDEIRKYTRFRKYLIKNGYFMLQYSVYCKIFPNKKALEQHITQLNKNLPKKGSIRILAITEKQYGNMQVLVGGKTNEEIHLLKQTIINL